MPARDFFRVNMLGPAAPELVFILDISANFSKCLTQLLTGLLKMHNIKSNKKWTVAYYVYSKTDTNSKFLFLPMSIFNNGLGNLEGVSSTSLKSSSKNERDSLNESSFSEIKISKSKYRYYRIK